MDYGSFCVWAASFMDAYDSSRDGLRIKKGRRNTNTSRWEISFDEEGKELLILSGPARTVVEMLPKMQEAV